MTSEPDFVDDPEFDEPKPERAAPPLPSTGWQITYGVVKRLLLAFLPLGLIVGAGVAYDTWLREPRPEWLILVQREGYGDDWNIVGEHVDEAGCLAEAKARNEPEKLPWFECYARNESPGDEASIERQLERSGYKATWR